jgi:fucose 4-O-acetylase-like acetyltransferase
VLWAHSVQDLKNGAGSWNYPVNAYVVSFVMPLFFLLSGFFFKSSLRNNFKEFLSKKTVQLLLPWLFWSVATGIYYYLAAPDKADIKISDIVKTAFGGYLWFVRELFISYLITFVAYKVFRKEYQAIIISIGLVLILPLCKLQSALLPFFITGILIKDNYALILKYANRLMIAATLIFGACWFFWDVSYYTLNAQVFDWNTLSFTFAHVKTAIFFFITGLSGSMVFFFLFSKIYRDHSFFSYMSKAGKYTLGIYILQVPVLQIFLNNAIDFPAMNKWVYCFAATPVTAFLILVFCCFVIKLVHKNKYLELLLFGNSFQKYAK